MIKSKKCCIEICNFPAFSKGFCKKHCSFKELKSNSKIKTQREKTAEKKKEVTERRNVYFEYHLSKCRYSAESGVSISNPTRVNICHILPKRNHESLEDNLDNCVYLTQEEHSVFDTLLFSHEFEKLEKTFKNSWENTCLIIEKLLTLCKETTPLTRALKKYLDGRNTQSR